MREAEAAMDERHTLRPELRVAHAALRETMRYPAAAMLPAENLVWPL